MIPPFEKAIQIVKEHEKPQTALAELIALCAGLLPDENWTGLPVVDVFQDIDEAASWLSAQWIEANAPTGIYLGLDTMNMDDGDGHNIEFGWSHNDTSASHSHDWLYELNYGDDHLIYGLHLLHGEYASGSWSRDGYDLCDYILFLGYSGIVLLQALRKIASSQDCLVVWGFHDGDLFRLAKINTGDVSRICEVI